MSPPEPPARELSHQEMATALDWLDGELPVESACEFELRLAEDPELALQVEALADMDEALRRDARHRARTERTRRRWNAGLLLAAASLIGVAILPQVFVRRAPDFEVAVAPSWALAEDWASAQPELAGASAPGIAAMRGAAPRQLSAGEFLRASELSENLVAVTALSAERREIAAGWFVVPLELDEPASVVVVGLPQSGPALRLFPEGAQDARVPSGRHLLPSARAVPGAAAQTLDYRPGFLVPLGAVELAVLVGVRREPLEPGVIEAIDALLERGLTADATEARLRRLGFRVERLSVREP